MSAAHAFDEVAALDAILIRTIGLRRLQRELRGEVYEEGYVAPADVSPHVSSYRYGMRRHNPGQSRNAGR